MTQERDKELPDRMHELAESVGEDGLEQTSNALHQMARDMHAELTALRAELEAARRGAEWIPVSEWLPEDGRVLGATLTGNIMTVDVRQVRNLMRAAKIEGDDCYYTHWMPLPTAPDAAMKEGKP